jgi:RNA polymerase sigma-70 factor (ECF subfamily)
MDLGPNRLPFPGGGRPPPHLDGHPRRGPGCTGCAPGCNLEFPSAVQPGEPDREGSALQSESVVVDEEQPTVRALLEGGDVESAYARVVEATQDSLYRFLRHMLRDEEAAREVFQDTYLRVFRALGSFRGEASLTTWVLTIGRNTALNRIRGRKGREDRTGSLDDPNAYHPEASTPAVEPAMTRTVTAALDALPEAQREAVLLFYGEDLPLAEVAELTGRPVNTVKSDLLRARKRLREILEGGSALL